MRKTGTYFLLAVFALSTFGANLFTGVPAAESAAGGGTPGDQIVNPGGRIDPGLLLPTKPAAPSDLLVTGITSTSVSLAWKANSKNEEKFMVYRTVDDPNPMLGKGFTVAANTTSFTDTGLETGKKYYYQVMACNAVGNSDWSNIVSAATTDIPSSPTGLTATADATTITLNWTDVSNEMGYNIERKKEGGTYVKTASTKENVTSYSDTGLDPATKYYYRIRAYNYSGNSGFSNEANATTGAAPAAAAPAAPTELAATAMSGTEVSLSWKDNADNETGFKIESKPEGGNFTVVGEVGANVKTFTHSGLTAGIKYYYRVLAANAAGNSGYSNVAEVTTTAAAAQPVEVKLYIGASTYFVNNVPKQMDVGPVILGGRTLLPARYIAEALGANVQWVAAEKKVVITRGSKIIEMWVDQPKARVNGVEQYIDPGNTKVSPIIIPPGRTMTPGRFIAENLGATVAWDPATKEVKISYTP